MKISNLRDTHALSAQYMVDLPLGISVASGVNEAFKHIGLANQPWLRAAERIRLKDDWQHAALHMPRWLSTSASLTGQERWQHLLAQPGLFEGARRAAELTQGLHLPTALEAYRSPLEAMTLKLAEAGLREYWRDPTQQIWRDAHYLKAFNEAAALDELFAQSTTVTRGISAANRALMDQLTGFGSLAEYRALLDSAGLILPRWPRFRLMTEAEKRRHLRNKQRGRAEPSHFRKAKALVHNREAVLRDILATVMEDTYGEDWAYARLPKCGCKALLGRWKNGEGEVLDHADYAHYELIVADAEHFAEIFHVAFSNPEAASDLFKRAGTLRARSHHIRNFLPEDLRDLRVIWNTIDIALMALDQAWILETYEAMQT